MCSFHIFISLVFFFLTPSFGVFTFFVFLIYYCVGFVDALGEGMTAVITKMEIRLSDLKSQEEKETIYMDDIEKRSVGNYFVSRMALRALGTFLGGMIAKQFSIKIVYAIFAIFPLGVILWTVFFFNEITVNYPSYPNSNFFRTPNRVQVGNKLVTIPNHFCRYSKIKQSCIL